MTKRMSFHPVAPGPVSETGFGFDAIMQNPDHDRFLDWYHANSFFSSRRAVLESEFATVVDAAEAVFDEAA
jgi:hypothetical protein